MYTRSSIGQRVASSRISVGCNWDMEAVTAVICLYSNPVSVIVLVTKIIITIIIKRWHPACSSWEFIPTSSSPSASSLSSAFLLRRRQYLGNFFYFLLFLPFFPARNRSLHVITRFATKRMHEGMNLRQRPCICLFRTDTNFSPDQRGCTIKTQSNFCSRWVATDGGCFYGSTDDRHRQTWAFDSIWFDS